MANENLISSVEPQVTTYLAYLYAHPNGEEIQYRTPFETLFKELKLPFLNNATIVQEDRRSGIEIEGTPDFFVYKNYGAAVETRHATSLQSLVGFIECKKPSYNLEKLIDSEQIKKYSKTCKNIIITNYLRFILLQEGKKIHDITLSVDSNKGIYPLVIQDFVNLLQDFYGYDFPYINTKKMLASALAAQSFYYSVALREYIEDTQNETDSFYTKFKGLFSEYEKSINYHYLLADFCDIYAQSLVYGLLLARLDTGEPLNEQELNYLKNIPVEYRLLYEFLSQGYETRDLPTSIKIALTNIGKNINLIDTEAITKEFYKADNGKQNIAVYLYEDFLSQYDKLRGTENRKEGGVYYTPSEAANFITRGVNHLIKTCFDLPQGYNSGNVKVLDFACGTGTFLHSVFEQMIPENPDDLTVNTIKNKITKDIYGFELLFTPYVISHTVLTRFLKEKGIDLGKERLGIYLTNTLDISSHTISELLPALKREYEKARDIKDKESILAIVGNPPYFNGRSQAKSDVIDAELYKYKQGLNEKKINLDDSYIKFIRFAEWKIERCGYGLVGIITNNSFLYGVTYRQMRRHLYETFDEIYVVNLHGDSDRKEPDKNIFDIKRGVSIVFLVKKIKPAKNKKVYYLSTLQHDIISRNQKLSFLENTEFTTVKWEKVKPTETANYWFISKDFSEQETYRNFWKLTDVFQEWNSGLESGNDDAAFFYTKKDLDDRCKDYTTLPEHILREKYGIKDKENWILKNAIEDLKKANNPQTLYYRPFDIRWTSLSKSSKSFLGRPRYEITKHFDNRENIGIVFKKELNRNKFNTILVVDKIFDRTILETSHGGAFVAPLYYYNGHKQNGVYELEFEDSSVKSDNFTPKFIKNYLQKLPFKPAPEEILAYIYAVLHSPVYRTKYLEFLKTDFPAVPMTANEEFFKEYANLGQQLIDLHLLRNLPNDKEIRVSFDFENNFTIEKIELSGENLFLNVAGGKTITISGITEAIYNFEIGSYRPIDKWLKYRIKDHVSLSISDLTHLKNMIVAIKGTIATMQEVENLGENYLQ